MQEKNLETALRDSGGAVKLLRNAQTGPYVYPGVPPEYTNWRDEQRAWQKTCVLFNQSYHMTDMYLEGPGALKLLESLGVNSFKGFEVNKAKQYVPCTPDGYVIGDVVLCYLDRYKFNLIGRPSVHNWVQYNCESQKIDAVCERDERAAARLGGGAVTRKAYRFQVQGPNALPLISKLIGGPVPEIKFFNMCTLSISGRQVRALRHGMAGQPGFELFGPWEEGEEVRQAILEAGKDFGIRAVGARAYSSNTLESGWIPSPMPAIYTGDSLKAYREWLPANGYEGTASLGGSFDSEDIRDYYLTPFDLGYGPFVKFDHDFVGSAALQKMSEQPRRKKVTLALDNEDVARAMNSMFDKGESAKYFDFPSAVYSTLPYDRVEIDGKLVGLSTWCGYSFNEKRMLTLAMLDVEHAEPGTEVTFVWGEKDGGTSKPTVERHKQTRIRAIVSPVPYAEVARISYAPPGWRARQA